MTDQSKIMLESVFGSDPTITTDQQSRIMDILCGGGAGTNGHSRLVSRKQAGEILNKTPQMVDYYASKGLLKKVKIGDASRASGILESSIYALLEGTGQVAV